MESIGQEGGSASLLGLTHLLVGDGQDQWSECRHRRALYEVLFGGGGGQEDEACPS